MNTNQILHIKALNATEDMLKNLDHVSINIGQYVKAYDVLSGEHHEAYQVRLALGALRDQIGRLIVDLNEQYYLKTKKPNT